MGYIFCELNNSSDIIEFEKLLYKAFTEKTKSKFRQDKYKVINGDRYRCYISYDEQSIFAIKRDGKIQCAISVRTAITGKMIIEEIGFKILEQDKNRKICEGIDFYNFIQFSIDMYEVLPKFLDYVLVEIKKKGNEVFYGSCEDRLKLLYRESNFEFIDSIDLNGTKEHLLRLEL